MKQIFTLLFFFIGITVFAQSGIFITTHDPQNELSKVVAHTDSSLFLLNIKQYEKGKYDFYVSKHQAYKTNIGFDTCLYIAKLFNGKLDARTFKHSIFQCKENLLFVFDVYAGSHRKVIAKAISFNGNVSDAFVLDDCDLSNTELIECIYTYELTDKKELLITLRRKYKSGFQRDKCILYTEYMSKLWEYEFPKISYHYNVNIPAAVFNSNQLIYHVANGFIDKAGGEWTIRSNYDTIVHRTVDGLVYDLKIPKDSLNIIVVNPVQKTSAQYNVYWPFKTRPILVPISPSQILLYNLVDIDDEKFVLPSKKAMYYKRIDVKTNKVLFEELHPFNLHVQDNLTYLCQGNSNRPTAKHFYLMFEKVANGRITTLFQNNCFEESEIIASSYNITTNTFEWMHLFPRKIATSSPLNSLTFSYSSNNFDIGFYESKKNFDIQLSAYKHNKYKMVRGNEDSQFISWSIGDEGVPRKTKVDSDSEDFLFPWLKNKEPYDSNNFFESKWFFPAKFIYR
ncbi:MAG: hypothetical protein HY062_05155 [Bacteroidetes bacterium]|nr:hypothetical protein [Bacteroidota bacterium]